jgi:hypothetical protein
MHQNMIALAIGAGELIWGVILKFAPLKYFQCIGMAEEPMTPEQRSKSVLSRAKNNGSTATKKDNYEKM